MKEKDTYKYHLKLGNKIIDSSITYDLVRREAEHQREFPGSRVVQVGQRTTWSKAQEWEKRVKKGLTTKQFLKESPAAWILLGLIIVLILLGLAIISKNWTRCILLGILIVWMLLCLKKDYTIWKLTKGSKKDENLL